MTRARPRVRYWFGAMLATSLTLAACGAKHENHAPPAEQSFTGGIAQGKGPEAGVPEIPDAAVLDSAMPICMTGALSVPFATNDPCDQVASSCSLQGYTTVAMCQPDGKWGPCYCLNTAATGIAGAGGSTTVGFGVSGLGF